MPSNTTGRDEGIVSRYLSEKISAERLAMDFGISSLRVRQILKAAGVSKKDRPPDLKDEGDRTLSSRHVKIGKYVSFERGFTLGVDRTYLAGKLGWSAIKLASVEHGTFNLTLIDMEDLARIFETSLTGLLEASEATTETTESHPPSNN